MMNAAIRAEGLSPVLALCKACSERSSAHARFLLFDEVCGCSRTACRGAAFALSCAHVRRCCMQLCTAGGLMPDAESLVLLC